MMSADSRLGGDMVAATGALTLLEKSFFFILFLFYYFSRSTLVRSDIDVGQEAFLSAVWTSCHILSDFHVINVTHA